ncbi:MAG TPA: outer membrane beta-barrel protein [Prevotella sp.]|nr:outer membrane beta-barrel protein [Prevotella sp.]
MSNDWTNKLRVRLTDYQEPVTDDLWAAIQQSLAQQKSDIVSIGKSVDSLDGHSNHQSNAKEVVFRRFSIAAALAALAVGGTYIYLNPTKSNEPIAQATVLQEDSSTSKGALHENQSSEHNQVSQEYSSDNTDTDSPSRLGDDTFTKYSKRVKKQLGIQTSLLDGEGSKLFTQNLDNDKQNDNRQDQNRNKVQSRSKKSLEGNPEMLAMAASPSSYAIQESNVRRHQSSSWSVQLYGENGVVGSKNSNGFDAAFIPSNNASGPVYPGNFTDAFYSVMAIRALSGTPSADYYEKVKHHFPISVGVQVGWGVTECLRINTGVVYTNVSSDFINSSYNTTQVTTQTLHYVGVPVNISYDFWQTKRFKTYVTAGGEADFNVKNHTESDGEVMASKHDRTQWSANASLGAQFDIIPQLGIYVEPGAKYYFDNGSQIENTFKDKRLNFNLQFGLRWNIK